MHPNIFLLREVGGCAIYAMTVLLVLVASLFAGTINTTRVVSGDFLGRIRVNDSGYFVETF